MPLLSAWLLSCSTPATRPVATPPSARREVGAAARWVVDKDDHGSNYGSTLAGLGDVDGDGIDDFAVGYPGGYYDGVDVFLGAVGGPSVTPWQTLSGADYGDFGASLDGAGDVNGDGLADILVGGPGTSGPGSCSGEYGGPDCGTGAQLLYFGSPGGLSATPDWEVWGDRELRALGESAAGVGDVDGDGFDDVVAGSLKFDGQMNLYLGGSAGPSPLPDWTVEASDTEFIGLDAAGLGDVDGDGYPDFLVSAPGNTDNVQGAWLFLGGATGPAATPDTVLYPGGLSSSTGRMVSPAGDVNGDGFADALAASIPHWSDTDDLAVVGLYLGSAAGLSDTPVTEFTAAARYDSDDGPSLPTARIARGVGDLDCDGFDDVAVGAGWADGSMAEEGLLEVHFGSVSGLEETARESWSGGADYPGFGQPVAAAGDTDGDGVPEILSANRGHPYVFLLELDGIDGAACSDAGGPDDTGEPGDTDEPDETGEPGDTGVDSAVDTDPPDTSLAEPDQEERAVREQETGCGRGGSALMLFLLPLAFRRRTGSD